MKKSAKNLFLCEKIEDVQYEEEKVFGLEMIWFRFGYGDCQYRICIQNQWKQQSYAIYHEREIDKDLCLFCKNNSTSCSGLNKHKKEIVDYLFKQPGIRLRWLLKTQQEGRI